MTLGRDMKTVMRPNAQPTPCVTRQFLAAMCAKANSPSLAQGLGGHTEHSGAGASPAGLAHRICLIERLIPQTRGS